MYMQVIFFCRATYKKLVSKITNIFKFCCSKEPSSYVLPRGDNKVSSLTRQAWEPKHPALKEFTWTGEQGSVLQPSSWGRCANNKELWEWVLARAEAFATSVWLMQAMLAKTHCKPWPALITLKRGIIFTVTVIRLCQKEPFSILVVTNIYQNALRPYLTKLHFTVSKGYSLALFTQLLSSRWWGGFCPHLLQGMGVLVFY